MLEAACNSPPGTVRIVNVTSVGHTLFAPSCGIDFEDIDQPKGGGAWSRYGMSKLANILHAKELYKRYGTPAARSAYSSAANGGDKDDGEIWTVSVHPGSVNT